MAKRRSRKAARPRAQKSDNGRLVGAGIVLLVLVVTIAAYFTFYRPAADTADVLVHVNGRAITAQQLAFHYNLLPASYQAQMTQEDVLERLIEEELVIQAAEREGFSATPADVNERIQAILSRSQMSAADLEENLASFNVTLADFERLIARQIAIERYTNRTIEVPEPTEEQLRDLYAVGKERFATPEQVTVRHVLISTQRSDAAVTAKQVYDAARAGGDFCTLVENHTDDRGSKGTCGQYTFPRGFMVPEFEKASFEMKPGEIRMVQTQFGYHVIEKRNTTPAGVQPFEDVRETLAAEFRAAEQVKQYKAMVSRLRDDAVIEYPAVSAPATGNVVAEIEVEAEPLEPADVPADEPATTSEPVVEEPAEEPAEVAPADPVEPADASLSCIAGRAKLYGASWNSDTRDALRMFGGQLDHTLCDKETCEGIKAYPTWVIGGKQYLGRLTLDELKSLTGC